MSSLRRRGGVWYLQWSVKGEVFRRSTRIRVSEDPRGLIARQMQRDFDSSQARQIAGLEDEAVTIAEGLERYLSTIRRASAGWQADTRTRAARWVEWLKRRGVEVWDEIRPAALDDYMEQRGRVVSAKTLRTEVDLLRSAARALNKTRTVRPIPVESWPTVERVTASRPDRIGAYSAEELERILADLGAMKRRAHWVFPVLCLAYLGVRWSELEALTVRDVRLSPAPAMVRVESRKTARSIATQHRWVEIHRRLIPEVTARVSGRRPGDRLIEGLPKKRDANHVLTRCCARLGIQYKRLHGFRHFWISTMLASGAPLAVVMKMAGHRNLSTTQGYLHLPDSHAGWVGNALPDGAAEGPAELTPELTPEPAGKRGFPGVKAKTKKARSAARKARLRRPPNRFESR